jgi:hydrogenase-4 component B
VVETAARRVARLQSGNIRVYLGWTLSTLLVLLWIIS